MAVELRLGEIRRRLPQDLVRPLQLTVLLLSALTLGRSSLDVAAFKPSSMSARFTHLRTVSNL